MEARLQLVEAPAVSTRDMRADRSTRESTVASSARGANSSAGALGPSDGAWARRAVSASRIVRATVTSR